MCLLPAPVPPVGTWVEVRCLDSLMPGDPLKLGNYAIMDNYQQIKSEFKIIDLLLFFMFLQSNFVLNLKLGDVGIVLNQAKISAFACQPRPDWRGPGPFIGHKSINYSMMLE